MQFSKYIALAVAVAMPALALPTVSERTVGSAVIEGRSYLIVNKLADTESVEKRGTAGDKFKDADGNVYTLVPVKRSADDLVERSYLIVNKLADSESAE